MTSTTDVNQPSLSDYATQPAKQGRAKPIVETTYSVRLVYLFSGGSNGGLEDPPPPGVFLLVSMKIPTELAFRRPCPPPLGLQTRVSVYILLYMSDNVYMLLTSRCQTSKHKNTQGRSDIVSRSAVIFTAGYTP